MGVYLEIWGPSGPEARPLSDDKITLGKSRINDVAITGDKTVSRAHAVLERLSSGWTLRDLGSRSGSFVNGERILSERVLHDRDEIRLGGARIVFHDDRPAGATSVTAATAPPPELTRRERDVLVELCQPFLSGDMFTEPASIRQIANRLFLTEATVKHHLARLYDKFGIPEGGGRRRVQLANDAVHRGAVNIADLRSRLPSDPRSNELADP